MMSILTVNLRQLYQRRGLWLAYVLLGFFIWMGIMVAMDDPAAGAGKFIGLVVFELLVGLLAAVQQMEILTKPFAFCLPGHRQMVRKFIFVIAVVTNVPGSLLFLFYPRVPLGLMSVILCSAFCAGMIFYLAGVWLAFGTKQPLSFVGFMVAAFFFGPMLGLPRVLEIVIVQHPAEVIVLGLLVSVAMWLRLGRTDLARRSCLRPWIGFEALDYRKLRRHQSQFRAEHWKRLKDHPRPWIENLFFKRIERCHPLSAARCIWGALYTAFSMFLSRWSSVVWFVLFIALALGYLGPRMSGIIAFWPLILMSNAKPPVFSSMLSVGGRNERFYSTLTAAVVGSVLLALGIGAVIAVSALLSLVMPDIQYRSFTLSYRIVGAQCFYVLVLLPIAATLHLVLYRKPFLMMVALIMMVYGIVMGDVMTRTGPFVAFGLKIGVAVGVAAWILFVLILRHISARRCLTG